MTSNQLTWHSRVSLFFSTLWCLIEDMANLNFSKTRTLWFLNRFWWKLVWFMSRSRVSIVLSKNWLSFGPLKFNVSTITACLLISTNEYVVSIRDFPDEVKVGDVRLQPFQKGFHWTSFREGSLDQSLNKRTEKTSLIDPTCCICCWKCWTWSSGTSGRRKRRRLCRRHPGSLRWKRMKSPDLASRVEPRRPGFVGRRWSRRQLTLCGWPGRQLCSWGRPGQLLSWFFERHAEGPCQAKQPQLGGSIPGMVDNAILNPVIQNKRHYGTKQSNLVSTDSFRSGSDASKGEAEVREGRALRPTKAL